MANVLVLDTPVNVLAFGMSNVIFSLLAAAVLLFPGRLRPLHRRLACDNPYQQKRHDRDDEQQRVPLPTIFPDPADLRAAAELAEAERADAVTAARPRRSPAWRRPTRCDRPRTGPRNGALRPTRTATDN
jgi:hypothetical protein